MTTILADDPRTQIASRSRKTHAGFFTAPDGARLFYRAWLPAIRATSAVLLLHRGHEHSGRWEKTIARLDLSSRAVAVFAYDARGHGRSDGERGYASSLSLLAQDLDAFVRFIQAEHDIAPQDMTLIAHSVAAVVAAAWVHDYAPPIRALVLATPALRVKLYIPLALPALRAISKLRRRPVFIKSYVRGKMLTHDGEEAAAYADDPLISRQIAVNVLLDLFDTSRRLIADAAAIEVPTTILAAGSDWVVDNRAIRSFHERLGSTCKSVHVLEGFHHAIFHESRPDIPVTLIRQFLEETERRQPNEQHRAVHNLDNFRRLSAPQPWWCPKRAAFFMQKLFVKTAGRLSDGVRLGWRSGFSSGQSLDYVYRDRASGITPLGRLIDRVYLNAIGWRMIRVRKQHVQAALEREIKRRAAARGPDDPIHVLDIAAGAGSYLLEMLARLRALEDQPCVQVTLCDRDQSALDAAAARARKLGLRDVNCRNSDAFDFDSLATIQPQPDVAIVSGLYELFPDNAAVLRSLRGLAASMRAGATLIYTNQPWHPQLEFIARVLTHADGSPWVMRCRPQVEMDALVRAAGFEKQSQSIDPKGLFSVCIARRSG